MCSIHGGDAPQVIHAAERRKLDAEVHKLLGKVGQVEPVSDPYTALCEVAGEMMWVKSVLAERVGELQSLEDIGSDKVATQLHVLMVAYKELLAMCGRITTDMTRLNLDAKIAELNSAISEASANMIRDALSGALSVVALSPEDTERVLRRFGDLMRTFDEPSQTPAIGPSAAV